MISLEFVWPKLQMKSVTAFFFLKCSTFSIILQSRHRQRWVCTCAFQALSPHGISKTNTFLHHFLHNPLPSPLCCCKHFITNEERHKAEQSRADYLKRQTQDFLIVLALPGLEERCDVTAADSFRKRVHSLNSFCLFVCKHSYVWFSYIRNTINV